MVNVDIFESQHQFPQKDPCRFEDEDADDYDE
jgi:hypothetical protein